MAEKIFLFKNGVTVKVGKFIDKDLPPSLAYVYVQDPLISFDMGISTFSSAALRNDFLAAFSLEDAERAVNVARGRALNGAKIEVKRIKRVLRTVPPLEMTEEGPGIPTEILES